jgi:hypothetical protein
VLLYAGASLDHSLPHLIGFKVDVSNSILKIHSISILPKSVITESFHPLKDDELRKDFFKITCPFRFIWQ